MSSKRYVYKLFVAFAAFGVSVAAISSPFLPGTSPVIQGQSPSPGETARPKALEVTSKAQRIFAPRWTTEDGFDTTIYIRNVQYNRAATASPVLQLRDRTLPLPSVSLEALETAEIDVRSALQHAGERADQSGAAYIAFDAPSSGGINAYAQLMNLPKSLSLSLPFIEVSAGQASPLRAVAWRYSSHTDAYMGLQNTTTKPVSIRATIVIEGRETPIREVHLDQGEFDVVKLPSPDGPGHADGDRTAGIVLQHNGEPGSILAQGWLLDDDVGFSAPFGFRGGVAPMSSKDPSERILGTGVMIGNPDPAMGLPPATVFSPRLAMWNPSSQPVVATASFSFTKNSRVQTAALPAIRLGPARSVLINLRDYQVGGIIPADVHQGNIKLEYDAEHDPLLADLASVDQNGTLVSPVPLTCAGNRGMHMVFWRTDGAWESMLTFQNVAAQANDIETRITWQGGEYVVQQAIAPGDSAMLSINEIQSSQQPDGKGRVIPRDVVLGGINILSQNEDRGLVINAMLMNPITRTCCGSQQIPYVTNFCLTDKQTTGVSPFYCGFDTHVVGDVFTLYISVLFSSGSQFNTTVGTSGSSNTSVATDGLSTVTDVGGGQASISGTSSGSFYTDGACDTGTLIDNGESLSVVALTVTIQFDGTGIPLKNGTAPQGTPPYINSVTMTAQGTPAGGSYSWSTSSNKVTLSNTTSQTVTVTSVSQSAAANDVAIMLTYNVNGVLGTAQISTTVQKPTVMGFVSVDANGANSCTAGQAGWRKVITWQVQDHLQPPGAIGFALPTWDTMNITSGQNGCNLSLSGTNPGGTTGSSGLWQHTYSHCSFVCAGGPCQTSGTQKYFVNGFEIDVPFTFACNSITVGGH